MIVKCTVVFVSVPGQVEVRVGSLAIVAFPAQRGGVKRRECGARGGGGAPPGLRGGEAVSAAQTLMETGSFSGVDLCLIYKLNILVMFIYNFNEACRKTQDHANKTFKLAQHFVRMHCDANRPIRYVNSFILISTAEITEPTLMVFLSLLSTESSTSSQG